MNTILLVTTFVIYFNGVTFPSRSALQAYLNTPAPVVYTHKSHTHTTTEITTDITTDNLPACNQYDAGSMYPAPVLSDYLDGDTPEDTAVLDWQEDLQWWEDIYNICE